MIRHIVMYCLREDCDKAAAIEEIRVALEGLVGVIPGLQTMKIRPAIGGSAGAIKDGRFDYILYSEFESQEALDGYKTHPAHLAVKPIVHGYITARVAGDCEE